MNCSKCENEAIFDDPEVFCQEHWAEFFAYGDKKFEQDLIDTMDCGMLEIIDWVRLNTEITHDAGDLIVGKKGNARFRIFPTEGFAGTISVGGNWSMAAASYTLDDFKSVLNDHIS